MWHPRPGKKKTLITCLYNFFKDGEPASILTAKIIKEKLNNFLFFNIKLQVFEPFNDNSVVEHDQFSATTEDQTQH